MRHSGGGYPAARMPSRRNEIDMTEEEIQAFLVGVQIERDPERVEGYGLRGELGPRQVGGHSLRD